MKLRNGAILFLYQNLTRIPLNVITKLQKVNIIIVIVTRRKATWRKKESHAKIANGDENSINKPDKIALKSSSQIKDTDWWIGSGASQHTAPETKSLNNYSTIEMLLKVKRTDNRVLYAYGKGNIHLTLLRGNNKINIVLKEELFVPKPQNKLFSLLSITEKELLPTLFIYLFILYLKLTKLQLKQI